MHDQWIIDDAEVLGEVPDDRRVPLARMQRIIGLAAADCSCRDRLESAVERFADQEHMREHHADLRRARRLKASMENLMELLEELDYLEARETDRSVFGEMALLFDTLAMNAQRAAMVLRQMEER